MFLLQFIGQVFNFEALYFLCATTDSSKSFRFDCQNVKQTNGNEIKFTIDFQILNTKNPLYEYETKC